MANCLSVAEFGTSPIQEKQRKDQKASKKMRLKIGSLSIDLVLLFLFISPIFYFVDFSRMDAVNPKIAFQQYQLFIFASSIILSATLKNKWACAFLLISSVHCSIQALKDPFAFMCLIPVTLACFVFDSLQRTEVSHKALAKVFLSVLGLNLLFACVQFFGLDVYFLQTNVQSSGLMLLPCYLGQYAVITAPLIYTLNPWLVLFPVVAVLISKSSFCVVAMVVSFLFLFYKTNRKFFYAILIFSCMASSFFMFSDSKTGQWDRRANVWKMVLSKSMRSPFVGHGLGSYNKTLFLEFNGSIHEYFQINVKPENTEIFLKKILDVCDRNNQNTDRLKEVHFKEPGAPWSNLKWIMDEMRGKSVNPISGYVWDQPHNEYLRIFYEFGLLGLVIMLGFVRSLIKKQKPVYVASLLGILVISFVHFPFYLPCLALTILVILSKL